MTDCPRRRLLTRRTMGGVAAAGIGVPLIAACSGDDTATDAGSGSGSSTQSSSAAAPSGSASAGGGATGFTTTADIEVGGGAIFPDEEIVVTQPSEGEFKAFSAVCTHQGCLVSSIEDGEIICDCHGSHFSIEDGEPDSGPASSPLEEVAITVTGDQISLA